MSNIDPLPDWQPHVDDIQWAAGFLSLVKDGATWGIPTSGDTYLIDKKSKTLTLIAGPGGELHQKNVKVFAKIGWQVNVKEATP